MNPCANGCQLGRAGCWGKCHPHLCLLVASDPNYASVVASLGEHPECGTIEFDWYGHAGLQRPPRAIRPWQPGSPIRLGLASPDLQIGGVGAWMLDLIRATQDAPFEWAGIAVADARQTYPPVVERFERLLPVAYGREAITELGRKVDLLAAWGLQDVHNLLEGTGCRTLLVSHGNCKWTKANLRDAQRATGCAAVAKAAARQFPAEVSSVQVIYNTARLGPQTVSRQEQQRRWGVPDGTKVAGYLGRISYEKYPEGVVRAVANLPEPWVGVLVGPFGEYLDKEIAKLGVAHRIYRPGPIGPDEIASVLAAFDVLLLPSIHEAHSIALTEAWLARVPVVATAVAITEEQPDLIREVPQQATGRAIADAVLADVNDPAGTRERVERAEDFARTELSFDRFRDSWRSFLLETVERTKDGVAAPAPVTPIPSLVPAIRTQAETLLDTFTEAQWDRLRTCPDRRQRTGCCGSQIDYCGRGKYGGANGRVMTAECAVCVAESTPSPERTS